jgi:hypothetical protein
VDVRTDFTSRGASRLVTVTPIEANKILKDILLSSKLERKNTTEERCVGKNEKLTFPWHVLQCFQSAGFTLLARLNALNCTHCINYKKSKLIRAMTATLTKSSNLQPFAFQCNHTVTQLSGQKEQ